MDCPSCGSLDTRRHYDDAMGACNTCGAVFMIEDEQEDDDE